MNIQERYLYSLGLSGKPIEWGSYLLVTSLTIEVAALLLLDSLCISECPRAASYHDTTDI